MTEFAREKPKARTARMLSLRVSVAEDRLIRAAAEARVWTVAELIRAALDEWLTRHPTRKGAGR